MYAVIEVGARQYKVEEGTEILVDKVFNEVGKQVSIAPLLISGGEKIDLSKKGTVKATVMEETKGKKVVAFKYRAKKGYKRKVGHRSQLIKLRIDKISSKEAKEVKPKEKKVQKKEAVS